MTSSLFRIVYREAENIRRQQLFTFQVIYSEYTIYIHV